MSEKLLWNSVVIKVPSEFITVDAKGRIKICPPLTKKGALAKKKGKAAISIVASDGNKVEVENTGEYQTPPERKVRTPRTPKIYSEQEALRKLQNKQLVKTRLNEKKENASMGKEDVNRAETMHEKMARLRAMRKNVTIRKKDKHRFNSEED